MKKNSAITVGMLSAAIIGASAFMPSDGGPGPKPKPALDLSYIDKAINPGDNFFKYANGKWLDTATIPTTESGAGSFLDLAKSTRENIKTLLNKVSQISNAPKGSIDQLVGDFYASGMDSATIEKLGYQPIEPTLQSIQQLTDSKSIMSFVANQLKNGGSGYFIGYYVGPDEKNSAVNAATFYQRGLGLPDRDYYFKTDANTQSVVAAYKKYLTTLFTLVGNDENTAKEKAETVFNFEKEIAAVHRTRVELRNPAKNYNKFSIADLTAKEPNIDWSAYMENVGAGGKVDSVIIGQPEYFEKINSLLASTPISTWKTYLDAATLRSAAPALSNAFVEANFEYSKSITGAQQIKPRWERMYQSTDGNLGEALGKLYVEKYFNEKSKQRMDQLVNNLQKAFAIRIEHLDWMGTKTKETAIEKLHAIIKKIGYPSKWRDYSKINISRDTYFQNLINTGKNDYDYNLAQLGKPVDKTLWEMTPPTINAYYNPVVNEIVFPAGILQPPFFNPNADDAVNYGGIGMVIGHEMTHGFDDQGSQYDKDGNMKNWWTEQDKKRFDEKVQKIIKLYSSFTILDSVHVNGALTTGENIADFGGINIAYDAFKMTKEGHTDTKIDGYTPDQRFFLSYAQIWRMKYKEAALRQRINVDPHSPAEWRVLGPLMNFTPFYKAFDVKPGDKMYLPENERLKIW